MPAEPFIGQIMWCGFNFAPRGWALCNGQLLPISQNVALFSLLGTTYGGNGTTTFALPDLRGRVPVQFGQGPGLSFYSQGETAGVETVTLAPNQIPPHSHALQCTTSVGNTAARSGALPAKPTLNDLIYRGVVPGAPLSSSSIAPLQNLPHSNLQPFLVANYCIALFGIYPSRP